MARNQIRTMRCVVTVSVPQRRPTWGRPHGPQAPRLGASGDVGAIPLPGAPD